MIERSMESLFLSLFVLALASFQQVNSEDDYTHATMLSGPRFHFSGNFIADVTTVNNRIENFDVRSFVSHHALHDRNGGNGGYNPPGTNGFLLKDVTVKRVCYKEGTCTQDVADDGIIGKHVQDDNLASTAKMVDIDPLEQRHTQIWGLAIKIPGIIRATAGVLSLNNLWKRQIFVNRTDESASAVFHGILNEIKWTSENTSSKLANQMRAELQRLRIKKLTIRFVVDMYNKKNGMGRMFGTIGCHGDRSPTSKLLGRLLMSQETKIYDDAVFNIDETNRIITFDFGNSFPTEENGRIIKNGSEYYVIALLRNETGMQRALLPDCFDDYERLAIVPTKEDDWLENKAGFFSFEISDKQVDALKSRPIFVIKVRGESTNTQCFEIVLQEPKDGIQLHPLEEFIHRKESGDQLKIDFLATKFGKPHPDIEVKFVHDERRVIAHTTGCCHPKFSLPEGLKTNKNGIARIDIQLPMLSSPREFIDGQIYRIAYFPENSVIAKAISRPAVAVNQAVILRVFDHFEYPKNITWVDHVYPIFKQYSNLYPAMKGSTFDMSNYHSVIKFKNMISTSMNLAVTHNSYMPATRDLSSRKRRMVTEWLAQESPAVGDVKKLITVEHLRELLQTALEIEHSTIPPYLTAQWSIRDGYNRQVHRIIKTIVRQEMLHMALVANLMNAVGGKPSLIHSTFMPQYPSKLPGGVEPSLVVSLEKLSPELVKNVFMQIEKPDTNKEHQNFRKGIFNHMQMAFINKKCKNGSANALCDKYQGNSMHTIFGHLRHGCPVEVNEYIKKMEAAKTGSQSEGKQKDLLNYKDGIASFYTHILFVLAHLTNCGTNNSIFTGNVSRQLTTDESRYGNGKLKKVTDYVSAVEAVKVVIEEGEGTSDCDPAIHYFDAKDDLSHYSLFHTIVKGHRVNIKRKKDPKEATFSESSADDCKDTSYEFSGKPVNFLPYATWPIMKNAKPSDYKKGTLVEVHSRIFSRLYNRLLGALHKTFNGEKEYFTNAKFLMYAVDYYGRQMVKRSIVVKISPFVGPTAAPIFKWVKTKVSKLRKGSHAEHSNFHAHAMHAHKLRILSQKKKEKQSKGKKPNLKSKHHEKQTRKYSQLKRKRLRQLTKHKRINNAKYRRRTDTRKRHTENRKKELNTLPYYFKDLDNTIEQLTDLNFDEIRPRYSDEESRLREDRFDPREISVEPQTELDDIRLGNEAGPQNQDDDIRRENEIDVPRHNIDDSLSEDDREADPQFETTSERRNEERLRDERSSLTDEQNDEFEDDDSEK